MPTPQDLLARLKTIPYPGFSRDIVSFGLVRDIEVSAAGVTVKLAPTTAKEEVIREIAEAVYRTLSETPGVTGEIAIVRERADPLGMALPPGPGDVQLTLTQQVAISGGIVVTTPQEVALADVRRGIQMFRQVNAPVLGVIENMSWHLCPGCGARAELFGHGGGAAMARELGVPFLGELPLVRAVSEAGDRGVPIVAADPSHPVSRAYREIAERVLVRVDEAARRVPEPAPRPAGLTVLR